MIQVENLTNVVSGLSVVLLLLVGLSLILKKAKGSIGINSKHLQTISAMQIGAKEKLLLVKIGNKKLLLGITQHNIRTLHVDDHVINETKKIVEKSKPPFINELISARKSNK